VAAVRRTVLIVCASALAAAALGFIAGYAVAKRGQGNDVVGSPSVEFLPKEVPKPVVLPGIAWPMWGYDSTRTRVAPYIHRPPYRVVWTFHAGSLLEFPPAIAYGSLYLTSNEGVTFAVRAKDGSIAWRNRSHRCAAASPAAEGKVIFQAFLNAPPCNSSRPPGQLDGEVVAFDALTGKVRWRTTIGPTESSPVVAGGNVYVGDWRGNVYALDRRTGRVRWTFHTGGSIKGAVAIIGTRLFVGAYDGNLYALDTRTGALQWRSSSQGTLIGRGSFYSTPAVAYGRVYIGSTDGKVYSFGATTGAEVWSTSTGGYVYSSPAVWNKTVFAGSYSGRVVGLDAATGARRWEFIANGPISGAPTVMGGLVYIATLHARTYALDARTGKVVWTFGDGRYTPLVADAERPYLVGYSTVYALTK
jgi:glucose dehydrogenase